MIMFDFLQFKSHIEFLYEENSYHNTESLSS